MNTADDLFYLGLGILMLVLVFTVSRRPTGRSSDPTLESRPEH